MKVSETIERIKELEIGKEDIQESKLAYSEEGLLVNNKRIEINDFAFNQLASKIGGQAKFLKLLPEEIMVDCINSRLQDLDKRYLVRMNDDCARAILSDKYQVIDNTHLINALKNLDEENYEVLDSSIIEDDRMFVKVIDKRGTKLGEVQGYGDMHNKGIILSNSEIGEKSVSIEGFIFRQFCFNGVITGKDTKAFYREYHSGKRNLNFDINATLQNAVIEMDKKLNNIGEMKNRIFSMGKFQEILTKNKGRIGLYNNEIEEIERTYFDYEPEPELNKKHEASFFGMLQGLTRYAKIQNPRRQYQLEKSADDLISLVS